MKPKAQSPRRLYRPVACAKLYHFGAVACGFLNCQDATANEHPSEI